MKDAFDENPYLPPESTEEVPLKMPGPAAMVLVGLASVVAWVVAFYGTCYGLLGVLRMVNNVEPLLVILAAAGLILPFLVAFLAARFVRRTLLKKLQE